MSAADPTKHPTAVPPRLPELSLEHGGLTSYSEVWAEGPAWGHCACEGPHGSRGRSVSTSAQLFRVEGMVFVIAMSNCPLLSQWKFSVIN